MSFENFLSIGKSVITGAINQRLFKENISVKNIDISIWQEILCPFNDNELEQPSSKSTQTEIKQNSLTQLNLQAEYLNLPFNSNGDIDFNELTYESLKTRFPESDYIIETNTERGEFIIVKSKKDGKFILSCSNTTNSEGEVFQDISFMHKDEPTILSYKNGKFSQKRTYYIDGGNINTDEFFDDKGNLIRKTVYDKDNTSYVDQVYSNYILCREITVTETNGSWGITKDKKFLSDKLIEDITKRINVSKSGIGFLPKTDDIEKYILDGISPHTIMPVLYDYEESTGRKLLQDIIDNKMGLEYEKQKELLQHMTLMTRESPQALHTKDFCYEGKSFGYELQFALKNNDSALLKETLNKVNKDNIYFALSTIYNISDNDSFTDFSDKLYPQLVSILGDDSNKYIFKFSDAMIQHINEKGGYTKDLVKDIDENKDFEINKSRINFTRLINRCEAGQTSTVAGKPDGKIDINNIQQKGTGDCWLLAAILSASNKNQKGLDYINSMLSVDANGNVTVELKGANEKYVVSAEEIEKSNHLASGDPDMRAIEIAVDKYMKDFSYKITSYGGQNYSRADINGDYESFAYLILFGAGYNNKNPDILNEDYNYENHVYTLSFEDNPNMKATLVNGTEQPEVDLIGRHAYAIKSSDAKYIYLINPHNSSETLQIERALLQTKNPSVCTAQIEDAEKVEK